MIKEPALGACWESEYGPAPLWNTSLVTDMSNTFRNKEHVELDDKCVGHASSDEHVRDVQKRQSV